MLEQWAWGLGSGPESWLWCLGACLRSPFVLGLRPSRHAHRPTRGRLTDGEEVEGASLRLPSTGSLSPCRERTPPAAHDAAPPEWTDSWRMPSRASQPLPRRRLRQTAMAARADAGQTASKTADAGRWPDGSQQTTDGHDPLPEADRGADLSAPSPRDRKSTNASKRVCRQKGLGFQAFFSCRHSKPEDLAGLCGSFRHLR